MLTHDQWSWLRSFDYSFMGGSWALVLMDGRIFIVDELLHVLIVKRANLPFPATFAK